MTPAELIRKHRESSLIVDIADEYPYLNAPLKDLKSKALYEYANETSTLLEMLETALAELEHLSLSDWKSTRYSAQAALTKINEIAGGLK